MERRNDKIALDNSLICAILIIVDIFAPSLWPSVRNSVGLHTRFSCHTGAHPFQNQTLAKSSSRKFLSFAIHPSLMGGVRGTCGGWFAPPGCGRCLSSRRERT